jgi:hypothetical protein
MAAEPQELEPGWPSNYFNYFTEVEEHFQKARGSGLFLLSPLDWALLEGWKNGGIPLEAVLRGIDVAFEKWRTKKTRTQAVNSLAYCAQAVAAEAEAIAKGTPPRDAAKTGEAPFEREELERHLERVAAAVEEAGFGEIAASLRELRTEAETHYAHLEELEQRLTMLEGKLTAAATARQSEEQLLAARQELDRQLKPYRSKLTAPQLAMLERQFLERKVLESAGLPRLSLFYLR